MFGKKKLVPEIDKEQLELIKEAQKRIKQKKRLYSHFVFFLIGCALFILANIVLGVGETFKPFGVNWFVYAILIWTFLFLYHAFNVFITHKFMGKDWEAQQLNKLVDAQKKRIEKLKEKLPKDETLIKSKNSLNLETTNSSNPELTLIVAAAENNAIGKDNKLIWHLSDDLKHFKNLTNGHHIIMGRKTFESFPKPLPNRTHIVITRQKNYIVPDGVVVVNNLHDALDAAKKDSHPYIIGGGEIYKQALEIADKIEITRVHSIFDADTYFPVIDPEIWKETAKTFHPKDDKNDYDFSFITYERR